MFPSMIERPPHSRRLRIALDLVGTDRWVELTASRGAGPEVVRITAADLRAAQRITAGIHADARRKHTAASVLVDLDAMIDDVARVARTQMGHHDDHAGGTTRPDSLSYVGTPRGLAGLIGDVFTAGVADGVTVRPLSSGTFEKFFESTLPELAHFGITIGPTGRGVLEACRRQHVDAMASTHARGRSA